MAGDPSEGRPVACLAAGAAPVGPAGADRPAGAASAHGRGEGREAESRAGCRRTPTMLSPPGLDVGRPRRGRCGDRRRSSGDRRPARIRRILDGAADGRRRRDLSARRRADQGRPGDHGGEPRGAGAAARPIGGAPCRPAAGWDARARWPGQVGAAPADPADGTRPTWWSVRSRASVFPSPGGCAVRCGHGPKTSCPRRRSTRPPSSGRRRFERRGPTTSAAGVTRSYEIWAVLMAQSWLFGLKG